MAYAVYPSDPYYHLIKASRHQTLYGPRTINRRGPQGEHLPPASVGVEMPRLDAYTLCPRCEAEQAEQCRRLKEPDGRTPIVMYSGLAFERDRREGYCAGADAYVTKPNIDGLLSVVEDLLKGERPADDPPRVA